MEGELNDYPLHGEQPINIRQELGIMFGFMAACILTVAVYYIFWQGNPLILRHISQEGEHTNRQTEKHPNAAPPPATKPVAKISEPAASITNEADTTTRPSIDTQAEIRLRRHRDKHSNF